MAKVSEDTVRKGSGNVFADIGFKDADELLLRAQLVDAIRHGIRQRNWKQREAADVLGIDQSKISALLRGDTRGFSADRLLRILSRLGFNVDISIKPQRDRKAVGHVRVREFLAA